MQFNKLLSSGNEDGEVSKAHSYHSREGESTVEGGSVLTRATLWGCVNQLYQ